MDPVDLLRRARRRWRRRNAPPPPDRKRLGLEAYRDRRWKTAVRELDAALRRGGDRETWLAAASAHGRLKDDARRDAYLAVGDRLFPSRDYDSSSAFARFRMNPRERDEIGTWLVGRIAALRAEAERALAAATTEPGRHAFVYWDSLERPDVVEHCIAAMRANLPADVELVELNAGNVDEWVRIDQRLLDPVDIPAHYSDLLRLHLLSRHGGLWLDASCLINEQFAEWVEGPRREDLFLLSYGGSRTASWFISARPDSYRLQLLRAAFDAWFLDGRPWTNYFMFHDFIEMLYWADERYRQEWDAGLHLHPGFAFDVHKALGKPLTDEEWAGVRHRHPVNKLSWRKYNAPELRADATAGVSRFIAEPLAPPAG